MIRASALYANKEGAEFNFDYYRDQHFPMVMGLLKPFGAIRFEIEKGIGMSDGSSPDFIAVGHMYFESLEGLEAGLAEHGAQIMGDVKNYSNLKPRLQIGEVL